MRFLVISDLHGKLEVLDRLEDEFKAADAVLFAGDFTKFNKYETAEPCVRKMRSLHENIFAVIGNCDKRELLDDIEKQDMCCERSLVYFEGLAFAGSGGGSKFTGTTPNEREEKELLSDFDVIKTAGEDKTGPSGQWNNLILISHNPPKDTVCDQCAPGVHAGSAMLSDFVKETKPLALITGHIHEGAGADRIGESVVINPGPLSDGKYAVMEVENNGGTWRVVKTELKSL